MRSIICVDTGIKTSPAHPRFTLLCMCGLHPELYGLHPAPLE